MLTRPRLAVLLSTFAALLVAGCSSGQPANNAPLPDAKTLIQQSVDTTKAQKSVHLVITIAGKIQELPLESLTGDLTVTPAVAAQGTANIDFLGKTLKDVPFAVIDGNLYASLTGAGGALTEIGPAADIYDVSAILSADKGLANVLANFSDPKAEGREQVGGTDTVKVTGTVSAAAVNGIAPQIAATGPVPATAWIAESGDHHLVQAKLDVSQGNSLQLTLSDWGKPVTVAKPAG